MAAEDLVSLVLGHWGFWLVVSLIVVYFILKQYNKGKLRPEQQPDFGVKFRAARTKKSLEKREKAFGFPPDIKTILYFGHRSLGRVLNVDEAKTIDTGGKKPETVMLSVITYRRFGLLNWLLASLGIGKIKIIVDDTSLIKGEEKLKGKRFDTLCVPANAFFRERGGVLFLSRDAEKRFIDEINVDMDYENAKGFVSDFPRRLSNLHPSQAIQTEQMELEESLEGKARERKTSIFRKGG